MKELIWHPLKVVSVSIFLLLFFILGIGISVQAQTCNCKEYIYLNEPAASSVLKFEVGSNIALTEVTGANGGPHWYPGSGTSELPSPHGLATDLNRNLYIHINGMSGNIRKFNCDGVITPTSPTTISTNEAYTQNMFSVDNNVYTLSGTITTTSPPATGTLMVSVPQLVANNIPNTGGSHIVRIFNGMFYGKRSYHYIYCPMCNTIQISGSNLFGASLGTFYPKIQSLTCHIDVNCGKYELYTT